MGEGREGGKGRGRGGQGLHCAKVWTHMYHETKDESNR